MSIKLLKIIKPQLDKQPELIALIDSALFIFLKESSNLILRFGTTSFFEEERRGKDIVESGTGLSK